MGICFNSRLKSHDHVSKVFKKDIFLHGWATNEAFVHMGGARVFLLERGGKKPGMGQTSRYWSAWEDNRGKARARGQLHTLPLLELPMLVYDTG